MESSDNEIMRLSKRMAQLGLCSRREADSYIEQGWVSVNGQVAVLGQKVTTADRIDLNKQAHERQAERVSILINKPMGYVSSQPEDGYKAAVELVTAENQWSGDTSRIQFQESHRYGLAPAGRLDIDSVGLLVLTQDGRVAKSLIGDKSDVDKEYLVRVEGSLSDEGLALLNHGLELDEVKLKRAQVSWQNEQQLRFVLHESRLNQIQRMCELVGLRVVSIKRIRIGSVSLGKLPAGQWRYLRDNERF